MVGTKSSLRPLRNGASGNTLSYPIAGRELWALASSCPSGLTCWIFAIEWLGSCTCLRHRESLQSRLLQALESHAVEIDQEEIVGPADTVPTYSTCTRCHRASIASSRALDRGRSVCQGFPVESAPDRHYRVGIGALSCRQRCLSEDFWVSTRRGGRTSDREPGHLA